MSGSLVRAILALVILAHGIGHILFLAPCLGITQWGQAAHSWLLTALVGDTATRVLGGVLWLAVIAGFLVASVGLLGQFAWWRVLAVAASGISLLALLLFASASNLQPVLSAGAMDVAILVSLLLLQWPPVELVGA